MATLCRTVRMTLPSCACRAAPARDSSMRLVSVRTWKKTAVKCCSLRRAQPSMTFLFAHSELTRLAIRRRPMEVFMPAYQPSLATSFRPRAIIGAFLLVASCSANGYLEGGTRPAGRDDARSTGTATSPRSDLTGTNSPDAGSNSPDAGTKATATAQAVYGMPDAVAAILSARCSGCHTYGQSDLGFWGSVL